MSAAHLGRSFQSTTDYQDYRLRAERDDLRRSNRALEKKTRKLRNEIGDMRTRHEKDVRKMAHQQARMEARQLQCENMVERVEHRQQEYERQAEHRRLQMERELRAEIRDTGERLDERIDELAETTRRQIDAVRHEVGDLREHMNQEIGQVRSEIAATRRELEQEIEEVRDDLQQQVDGVREEIRRKKESRSAEAAEVARWVEERLARQEGLDSLGLTIEGSRTREQLDLVRQRLSGKDPEMALPSAEIAFATYQTAHVEAERRIGVIDGMAEHVEEIAGQLEREAADETFAKVFPAEKERIERSAAELRERARQWRRRRHWHTFENEHPETVAQAHRLQALTLELKAVLPNVVDRLKEREKRMKEAAAVASDVLGLVDRFETTYANPDDPKSPRLLRAFVGRIHLDAHLELDGTYSYETYGFDSADECADTSRQVGQKLADRWQVLESRFDPSNPQQPSIALPPTSESWRELSGEMEKVTSALGGGR